MTLDLNYWKAIDGWFDDNDCVVYRGIVAKYGTDAKLAEIGTWKGRSLHSVLPLTKVLGYSQVVVVDTFLGSQSELNTFHAEVSNTNIRNIFETNLKNSGYYELVNIVAMESNHAANQFPNEYFDVIFIDAEHTFDAVKHDIISWLPKLKTGGTLVGHDWLWDSVRSAVTETLSGVSHSETMWWYFK